MKPTSNRIHSLMAEAAVSVIVVSLTGIAALTGLLPTLHATAVQPMPVTLQAPAASTIASPLAAVVQEVVKAPALQDETDQPKARPKPIVHHHRHIQAQRSPQYSQASAHQAPPAAAKPNSPIGIGVGAAVGGGYLGNEIVKRNP